ncbi:MAG: hypothetical protein JXN59_11475 [Anaerolineae bacterium]|nr:hypothetical protein [Anaerolineae bacterium]
MATNARTWFYEPPEPNAYLLQERVNGTLWMARLSDIFFVAEQVEAPYRMSATWQGHPLLIEWETGQWLRMESDATLPVVIGAFSNVLQIPATLSYMDRTGRVITEWHRDGGNTRWREIQGNPTYQNPVRLGS